MLKKITSALCSAALTLGLLTVPAANADDTAKVRVMPLGDSITDGFTVDGGYRVPLWEKLDNAGLSSRIDFVGPNGWAIPDGADYNHAGYSGYAIADCPGRMGIYNFIDWLMEEYPADVVMLQIGTNDILSSYELGTAGERLELLVDSILTYIPEGGMLYVSTIPYMDADVTTYTDAYTVEEMDAAVDAYNADVRAVVAKKQAEGKPITQADINSVLTKSDLSDGVHPSVDGYHKMADYWFEVLSGYLNGDTPAPTETVPTETAETAETTEADSTEPSDTTEVTETDSTVPGETVETSGTDTTEPVTDALLRGDVDCNQICELNDLILLQKHMLGLTPLTEDSARRADLNEDSTVDIYDLALLKRLLLQSN